MPKIVSLKKNTAILAVLANKKKVHTNDFCLYYKQTSKKQLALVISVGKKSFKLAVVRNRIRRRVKAAFLCIHDLQLTTGLEIVCKIKPNFVVETDFLQLCKAVNKAYQIILMQIKKQAERK